MRLKVSNCKLQRRGGRRRTAAAGGRGSTHAPKQHRSLGGTATNWCQAGVTHTRPTLLLLGRHNNMYSWTVCACLCVCVCVWTERCALLKPERRQAAGCLLGDDDDAIGPAA